MVEISSRRFHFPVTKSFQKKKKTSYQVTKDTALFLSPSQTKIFFHAKLFEQSFDFLQCNYIVMRCVIRKVRDSTYFQYGCLFTPNDLICCQFVSNLFLIPFTHAFGGLAAGCILGCFQFKEDLFGLTFAICSCPNIISFMALCAIYFALTKAS